MNLKQNIHRVRKTSQKLRMLAARMVMAIAAVAYFLSAMEIAPLLFSAVGASMDRQHDIRIQVSASGVVVTLAHDDGLRAECPTRHGHSHEWPARLLVGPQGAGHGDHIANFALTETGLSSASDKLDVKCPVSEMPAFEWLPLVAGAHDPAISCAVSFESFAPPDIRPTRPVVLLI